MPPVRATHWRDRAAARRSAPLCWWNWAHPHAQARKSAGSSRSWPPQPAGPWQAPVAPKSSAPDASRHRRSSGNKRLPHPRPRRLRLRRSKAWRARSDAAALPDNPHRERPRGRSRAHHSGHKPAHRRGHKRLPQAGAPDRLAAHKDLRWSRSGRAQARACKKAPSARGDRRPGRDHIDWRPRHPANRKTAPRRDPAGAM